MQPNEWRDSHTATAARRETIRRVAIFFRGKHEELESKVNHP